MGDGIVRAWAFASLCGCALQAHSAPDTEGRICDAIGACWDQTGFPAPTHDDCATGLQGIHDIARVAVQKCDAIGAAHDPCDFSACVLGEIDRIGGEAL